MKKFINIPLVSCLMISAIFSSCEEEKIADVGQLPDLTPPVADFAFSSTAATNLSAEVSELAYQFYDFSENTISSTDYRWTIPNNAILRDIDPDDGEIPTLNDKQIRVQFPVEGTFEVSLEASDKLFQSDAITKEIVVVEPVLLVTPAVIQNPGFDGSRGVWRKDSFGNQYSGTGNFFRGTAEAAANMQAAKLSSGRAIYQVVEVTPNVDYVVSYYYSMKTSDTNPGEATVTIIGGEVNTPEELQVITDANEQLGRAVGTIAEGSKNYNQEFISFNSGDNTTVSIIGQRGAQEVIYDEFAIETIQPETF